MVTTPPVFPRWGTEGGQERISPPSHSPQGEREGRGKGEGLLEGVCQRGSVRGGASGRELKWKLKRSKELGVFKEVIFLGENSIK